VELENRDFVIGGPKKNMDRKCQVRIGNVHDERFKTYIIFKSISPIGPLQRRTRVKLTCAPLFLPGILAHTECTSGNKKFILRADKFFSLLFFPKSEEAGF
jgi:hypothetical protein